MPYKSVCKSQARVEFYADPSYFSGLAQSVFGLAIAE